MSTFNLDYPKARIPLAKANKREKGGDYSSSTFLPPNWSSPLNCN